MSAYPPLLQQDICYVEVGVLKNWKQLFLSVTYSLFIVAGVRHLFILILHLYNHEVPAKHPRDKVWTHEIPTRKNFRLTKYPRQKILDP